MWRETTKHERNLRIWREELDDFVPARVLDFHTHSFDASYPPQELTFSAAGAKLSQYTVEELLRDGAELYPDRDFQAVVFGVPHADADHTINNAYLARACTGKPVTPFRLLHLDDDPAALDADLTGGPWRGVKPYPCYVKRADGAESEIVDMLPHRLLEVLDAHASFVMLHIPRAARLADPVNQRQIVELAKRYRRVGFILAHIGRAYYYRCVEGSLDALRPLENVWVDTAMVNHRDVLAYTFRHIPPHRLLYGTDMPLSVAPGISVEINHQYTYVTPQPSALSIGDDHGKIVFTSFAYEQLRSLKRAVADCGLPRAFVEDIFWNNGRRLLAR